MITLTGPQDFTTRLALATLAGKPVRIINIRSDDQNPGLRDFEITFLRVLEGITNGSVIEISYTGTSVIYKPGLIIGGSHTFNCPLSRGVGYFVEPLLLLAPFGKKPLTVTLNGITSPVDDLDISVDAIRTVLFPALVKFGIERSELRIVRRGSAPKGGGQVVLSMPSQILQPKTLHATDQISINKIRGIAYSTRVSPTAVNRVVDRAREVLKASDVDTYIYSDVTKGEENGLSPGFGVTLVAETKTGWPVGAQATAAQGTIPEDLGELAAKRLFREIAMRGCMGRLELPMTVVLMTLGSEDLGRVLVGTEQVDSRLVQLLKDIAEFWPNTHAVFKNERDEHGNMTMLMKGTGFVNANKKIA